MCMERKRKNNFKKEKEKKGFWDNMESFAKDLSIKVGLFNGNVYIKSNFLLKFK